MSYILGKCQTYRLDKRLIQNDAKEDHEEYNGNEVIANDWSHHLKGSHALSKSHLTTTCLKEDFVLIYSHEGTLDISHLSSILHIAPQPFTRVHIRHHWIVLLSHIVSTHPLLNKFKQLSNLLFCTLTVVIPNNKGLSILSEGIECILKDMTWIDKYGTAQGTRPFRKVVCHCFFDCEVPNKVKVLSDHLGEDMVKHEIEWCQVVVAKGLKQGVGKVRDQAWFTDYWSIEVYDHELVVCIDKL